jgi:hypothetical protein
MGFCSDKTNVEFRGLTLEEAQETLVRAGASPEAAMEYGALMQRCDFGQFAGLKPTGPERQNDLKEAEKMIRRLEGEMR